MISAATDLSGWWIGYAVGTLVVVIVVLVVGAIILTARKIADIAEDGTRSLAEARDRTEALWQVATTNNVARDLLAGAKQAREALGGGEASNGDGYPSLPPIDPTAATVGGRHGLGGSTSGLAGHDPSENPSDDGG